MKKKTKKMFVIISSFIATMVDVIACAINWAFYDTQRIKGQEYLTESTSPSGTYTVTSYINNGGATTSYAVLCTMKNNINGKTKNIYWQYRCETADMEWLNDETIIINGIEINVKKDVYDYRKK